MDNKVKLLEILSSVRWKDLHKSHIGNITDCEYALGCIMDKNGNALIVITNDEINFEQGFQGLNPEWLNSEVLECGFYEAAGDLIGNIVASFKIDYEKQEA